MHPRGIHAVNKYLAQLTGVGQRGKPNSRLSARITTRVFVQSHLKTNHASE